MTVWRWSWRAAPFLALLVGGVLGFVLVAAPAFMAASERSGDFRNRQAAEWRACVADSRCDVERMKAAQEIDRQAFDSSNGMVMDGAWVYGSIGCAAVGGAFSTVILRPEPKKTTGDESA